MYTRRVHTALGRPRPSEHEVSRFTDGVIASMRQLHISASHQEEENSTPNRTERSKNAAAEITSLPSSRPSGGIDARALAAQPPPASKFTISRIQIGAYRGGGSGSYRGVGGARGGVSAFRGRVGGSRSGIGGPGRGGRSGRGERGERGGRRGGRRGQNSRLQEQEERPKRLYSPELWKLECAMEYGVSRPAIVGQTTMSSLREFVPSLPLTTTGIKNTIKDNMEAVSGGSLESVKDARQRLSSNKYVSLKDFKEERQVMGQKKKLTPVEFSGGNNKILRELVAGEYEAMKAGPERDISALLQNYTQKNNTYLPRDASKLMGKVRTLVHQEQGGKGTRARVA